MFSVNIISVNFLLPFFCKPFKYVFNCGSRKISNFEKWLGLSRSLATPDIEHTLDNSIDFYVSRWQLLSVFRYIRKHTKKKFGLANVMVSSLTYKTQMPSYFPGKNCSL